MTEEKGKEILKKGNELADKLVEVLQKELGEEVPSTMTLFAAAMFSARILNAARKQMDDVAIVNDFFYAVGSLLGNEIEASELQTVHDKIREARQKVAEHRKMEAVIDKNIEIFDRRWADLKRKIEEQNRKLYATKQKFYLINQSSDDDKLN